MHLMRAIKDAIDAGGRYVRGTGGLHPLLEWPVLERDERMPSEWTFEPSEDGYAIVGRLYLGKVRSARLSNSFDVVQRRRGLEVVFGRRKPRVYTGRTPPIDCRAAYVEMLGTGDPMRIVVACGSDRALAWKVLREGVGMSAASASEFIGGARSALYKMKPWRGNYGEAIENIRARVKACERS